MRKSFIIIIVIALCTSCRTTKPAADVVSSVDQPELKEQGTDFSEQSTWLLGYFNPGRFSQPPHSEWYLKGFDEYKPLQEVIERLKATGSNEVSIQIVMGTWCPDSRREVPRFMKVLDLWGFPGEKITFIGVDNEKLSPVGDFDKLDIQRVPTFIILKNKIETGRIIENPVSSLEQDLSDILTRNE
jgi:thiol-disulfide isomerase/thioredoxin